MLLLQRAVVAQNLHVQCSGCSNAVTKKVHILADTSVKLPCATANPLVHSNRAWSLLLQVRLYEFDAVIDPTSSWRSATCDDDLAGHLYQLHGMMRRKSYFGVVSCLAGRAWPASVISIHGAELLRLSREKLQVSVAGLLHAVHLVTTCHMPSA